MECTFTNCLTASTSVALLKAAGLCSSSKSKSASDYVLSAWDCFTLHIVNVADHTSWAISATLTAALTLTHILALATFSHKAFANVQIMYTLMPCHKTTNILPSSCHTIRMELINSLCLIGCSLMLFTMFQERPLMRSSSSSSRVVQLISALFVVGMALASSAIAELAIPISKTLTPRKRNERSVHHSSQSSRHCKEGSPRRLRKRPHWLCDARSHQVCATQQTQEQNG